MTKTRWALFIVPLLLLALALAGGYTLLWRFFILLVVVMLFTYLWTRFSTRGIRGKVSEGPAYSPLGEDIKQEFTVSNNGRIPTPLIEAREDTNLPGYDNIRTFNLPPGRSYSWYTSAQCRQRGRYHLGAFTTRITDPLGFFTVNRQFGKQRDVIVFPATVELPFFQPQLQLEPGPGTKRWLTSEAGTSASRVRDYTTGDSLRHIHWQTTAHTGKLMVKEFDPDRSNFAFKDVWIVLDMHRRCNAGRGPESTEEYGITIAASLVKKYIESDKRVGLIAAGDRSHLFLPQSGDGHLRQIMQALALLKATGNVPLETLLQSKIDNFGAGSAVIAIMSSFGQNIAAALRRPVNRGVVVTAVLLDSLSFGSGLPATGMARGLSAAGVNVYIVGRGARIGRALDYRLPPVRIQGV
jgi:uncharacterized protein (DUF58 family)